MLVEYNGLGCMLFVDDCTIFYSADSMELLSNSQELSKQHNWLAGYNKSVSQY